MDLNEFIQGRSEYAMTRAAGACGKKLHEKLSLCGKNVQGRPRVT